jgi:hypothetical protein
LHFNGKERNGMTVFVNLFYLHQLSRSEGTKAIKFSATKPTTTTTTSNKN